MLAISMDMDWAPGEIVEDSLRLLAEHGIRATLFMTNTYELDFGEHEIGLHPNFVGSDLEGPLLELLQRFPGAMGSRSHSLFFSYRLVDIYKKLGIRYQSNVIMYGLPDIRAFQISRELLELPIFFMDNLHMLMHQEPISFHLEDLSVNSSGLKIFDFHPIHVFLNTERIERYERAKPHYHNVSKLVHFRNTVCPGTRTLFVDLLRFMARSRTQTATLGEIATLATASTK